MPRLYCLSKINPDEPPIVIESFPQSLSVEVACFWVGQYFSHSLLMLGERVRIDQTATTIDFVPETKNYFFRMEIQS